MTRAQHALLEADWQADVVGVATMFGWLVYHTFNSRQSAHGFPDLVLVRERVVYVELKRETGKPTEPQKQWLRALIIAGQEAYIARPSDARAVDLILSRSSGAVVAARALFEQTRVEVDG